MTSSELEALIAEHQAGIIRYLRFLGADLAVAEDLAQETFLAVYRSGQSPCGEGWEAARQSGWLRGIARNQFRMHCRRSKSERTRLEVVAQEKEMEASEAFWAGHFLRHDDGADYVDALRLCLEKLPAPKRHAIDLCYCEGKSRDEMAVALGMSDHGVKSLLRRIRQALGECIQGRMQLPSNGAEEHA